MWSYLVLYCIVVDDFPKAGLSSANTNRTKRGDAGGRLSALEVPRGIFLEGRRRRGGGSPTEASEEEEASASHQEEGEWVRMSGNILELEQLRDSRELSASQLHLLLHPTQVGWENIKAAFFKPPSF